MERNAIPKFHETFIPILEILSNGETLHTRELQRVVIEKYYAHLPENLLKEKTKTGEILINNRIAWGKSYLKKGGYIFYPERGHVKITEKGLNQKTNLTLQKVEEDSNFLSFYTDETSKKRPKKEEI
ncbi:MAG: winged helix-turn-helix domain-containing protein, partial [Hymenobacteraceae bacterium]|nr:winged helix-turn-helix domain-containing protein [Hymenobacteraceae bacterium]MDX5395768.1 winged helix-turn-helix domain-containing protein [Hymenobacteraceae bacterium]MDX5511823.1 winged helix-turn-helix domain-containing protein [Hymenobacteraceae bacterium]